MSLLTELPGLPAPDPAKVAPHRFRALGGRVLVVSEPGHWAFLTRAEYADYLRGLGDDHPRLDELRVKGFLAHYMEFDRLAADGLDSSLLGWEGTRRLVLLLARGRERMSPETARDAVDFAFSVPGPAVVLEAAAADPAACWPAARFIAEYAARRSAWNGRRSRVWLRTPERPSPAQVREMRGLGLGLLLELDAAGPARLAAAPAASGAPASRALLRWRPGARPAAAWAAALRKAGYGSALVSPEAVCKTADAPAFAAFYAEFLDAALSEGPALREEWAAAALRRLPPEGGRPREERGGPLPGTDLTGELCVAPWGELTLSERALDLPSDERGLHSLGVVGRTAWEELPGKDAVGAVLAALEGSHHPLCAQCVYRNACAVPPSRHQVLQGLFWGHLPTSPACRAAMGALDAVFTRLASDEPKDGLLAWADNWTLL
ncbi:MAG: hypothetical protein HY928_18155 [Elusimicrobia bacterium]|nr:hypothetical protein [Elusimicrobiota bacterium]